MVFPSSAGLDPGDSVMRVAILGPGSVGLFVAAVLARRGIDVTCIGPATTIERIRNDGIHLRSLTLGDAGVAVRAETQLSHAVDFAFVTVKETQLAKALDVIPISKVEDGLIVPLLNGLEHVARLRQTFLPHHVVAGTIRVEAIRVAPNIVEHASPFAIVELASDVEDSRTGLEGLADALVEAGIAATVSDDESATLWSKLVVLAPMALITTMTGAPIGDSLTMCEDDFTGMVHEIVAVAATQGVSLDARSTISFVRQRIPSETRSSMQRDAAAGRPIELDAIGGSILRAAKQGGIPTPVTERLVRELASKRAETGV